MTTQPTATPLPATAAHTQGRKSTAYTADSFIQMIAGLTPYKPFGRTMADADDAMTTVNRLIEIAHLVGPTANATERDRLRAVNEELVAALILYLGVGDQCSRGYLGLCQQEARAAIARAEGSK